ncbi:MULTISPECIES: phosphate ABC transporter substrate-binding protein PstS [Streptomyces]|uniref:Phosphate-binding protein n=1 Tax=Streptomyces tsukubensis (strain DSM 42081 / NBRC 108919 / NRRL 18488 / 9993) TaxID=1114943 RepID=I2N1A8_STRT9|nr:phosphate ABC transporter substrate-binding protein PstS [Streptomyces tsukubensis]MYS64865.1 phosphate ABC transporter substrate-binding protein PstS [Streptomyces sp. SID5473]AZK94967.1 phosphate ABC transporter substrate-binding protein PstS [Streptomyces tsukubensis]EIF90805.1 phosphate ABC transporter substrate-binding protein [Streptomyces tsukubensis NRRL18488]QKM68961.1 phosphate ABC transporter substrate-binding protein PstS [Streptomyces tsukubensis NRRL18488]TAI40824.1 phosphate 
MKLQRKNGLRATALGALAVTGALVLTACGSDDNTSSNGTGAGKATAASNISCEGAKGKLLASGSSAQKNAMDLWVKNYMAACSGVEINYKSSSSGEGIVAFNQGTVGFAGSDSALKPEEVAESKKICKSGQGINLPMVGGPVAIGYNLSGVDDLTLDAPTIAKIFNNKITKWNDPAIVKLNEGKSLPDKAIQAFHRSEDSGTTQNLGKYLGATAKADWPYEAEKKWPAPGGQAASGSSGVAAQVKQVDGAIGYFELSYATSQSIPTVSIDTGAAAPVKATSENASKAIAAAKVKGTGKDLALELDYATKAEGAYPIVLVTYEVVCDSGNKSDTLSTVKSFLTYTASDEGQKVLSDAGYAPIPVEINAKVRETVAGLN